MKSPLHLLIGFLCLFLPFMAMASEKSETSIYGKDDRIEVSEIKNALIANLSHAVALLSNNEWIRPTAANSCDYEGFEFSPDLPFGGILLKDQRRFSNQASAGYCTGFLIDDTHVMTAGHCVEEGKSCESVKIIFDYVADVNIKGNQMPVIPEGNIKTCKKVLITQKNRVSKKGSNSEDIDFAIIELNEPQVTRPRFTLTQDKFKPRIGTSVAMIGHPYGKPMKFSGDSSSEVIKNLRSTLIKRKNTIDASQFVTNLDAFTANSGSPVINPETAEVIGILVAGAEDRLIEDSVVTDKTYTEVPSPKEINRANDFRGERVTSIAAIRKEIENTLKESNTH